MQNTTNYNLRKPGGGDIVDINDLNTNADLIDEALTPAANPNLIPASNGPGRLIEWVSWIANRIKNITGKTNWYDAPDITLAGAKAHADAAAPHSGHVLTSDVVTTATANKLLKLNASSKLPASITGDADTVDGKHASDFAAAVHSHPFDAFINVNGTIPHGGTIPSTPGYTNHRYFVSLATIPATGGDYDIGFTQRGTYPNYYNVVVDPSRVGYVCSVDANRVVTAQVMTDRGTWVSGQANYIEIAWN